MEHQGHIQAAAPGQGGEWTPAVCTVEPGAIVFTVNAVEVARFDRTTTSIEAVELVFRVRGGDETLWFAPGDRERFRLDLSGSSSMTDKIALAATGPQPSQPTPAYVVVRQGRSRSTAGLLALLLGGLGVHRFYLGQIGLGFVYLLFSWTLIPAVIGLVDAIILFTMSDEQFARQYP